MAAAEREPASAPPIGGWRIQSAPADPRLRGLVTDTVWYEECGPGVRHREHLPGPAIGLIVNLGDRFTSHAAAEEPAVFDAGQGFVAGPSARPGASSMEGENRGVEIGLTPLGAYRLFGGRPLHELRDRAVGLGEVLGPDGERLLRQLVDAADPGQQLGLVQSFLLERLANEPAGGPFAWAWEQLSAAHGDLPMRTVARELGWSEKRLVRSFRTHFGLTPKKSARLMRFAHCVALAQEAPPNWAELALRCGYTDQAHLANEVRAFSGSTPTQLLSRILPAPPEPGKR